MVVYGRVYRHPETRGRASESPALVFGLPFASVLCSSLWSQGACPVHIKAHAPRVVSDVSAASRAQARAANNAAAFRLLPLQLYGER